jgi:hypothetical protein
MHELVAFLRRIGIDVEPASLDAPTFLPGLELDRGRLLVDEAKLRHPGDLLHEAGHVAVAPPRLREQLSGAVDVPGLDMAELEVAVVPWSYAAALEIGIDPAVVFHEGGYMGKSQGLLTTFAAGVYPGLPLLEAYGMAVGPRRAAELGLPAYPRMLRWLRLDEVRNEPREIVGDEAV